MKKLLGLALTVLIGLSLAACDTQDVQAEGTSYMSVEINPAVEFVLDEDGNVESVLYLNEDAEVVGADLDFVGLPSDEALERFIDAAIETGYIDVESDENIVTITRDDESEEQAAKEKVETILEERGIGATVFGGGINEEYEALAEEHDIDVGRARLISRAVEIDGEMTFEEALELEHSEIMRILIDEHRSQMDEFIEERRSQAQNQKNDMSSVVQDKVQAHRQAVEDGEVSEHDFDQIRNKAQDDLEAIRSRYESKMQERRQNAENGMPES
jgi:hypothetical protein